MMKYADVIIDNRSDSTDIPYTYGYDEGMEIGIGSKVFLPFARSKNLREGYVVSLQDEVDEKLASRIRLIDHPDGEISLTEEMIRTAGWMQRRYVCRWIDAIRCFTPAGRRPKRKITPEPVRESGPEHAKDLTAEQEHALGEICGALRRGTHARFLLHGVTGSGKTEVYMRAAQEAEHLGRTVIVLVPEISLTHQIVERFTGLFGQDRIAVLHSGLTLRQRFEEWKRIRQGRADIVIGARSAVFAPLSNIGLIIVDEEHETTYKSDSTPKYDTIEVAMKRLNDRDHQGVLLLGSATPSVVDYHRAQEGIYRILPMRKRYNEVPLPEVQIADMRQELRAGNRSVISEMLARQMQEQLSQGRQVMLFLNRRGYSTFISCRECGYVAKCPTCGLSLTYHSSSGMLACHYCGHEERMPRTCPDCGSQHIRYFGSGTEKVEETVRQLFPDRQTDRIDLDTIRRKGELKKRLKAFEKGQTDILIGTQIIAKGLDFRNVGLVGIISADVSLNIPDFRSPERAFQLITQAAGRAGRGDSVGRVVIQTYDPEHYAVIHAAGQDFDGFFREEIAFRRIMNYPPFSDIMQILFTAKEAASAEEGARRWYEQLMRLLPPEEQGNVFRPQEAYMSRIRDVYRYSLVLRCPLGKRAEYAKILRSLKEKDAKAKAGYLAVVDINPYSFA